FRHITVHPTFYYLYFHFFFTDTANTEIYTLSLHDALPIYLLRVGELLEHDFLERRECSLGIGLAQAAAISDLTGELRLGKRHRTDRKSTRLNSSHVAISYAVFCLKKKNIKSLRSTERLRTAPSTLEPFGQLL